MDNICLSSRWHQTDLQSQNINSPPNGNTAHLHFLGDSNYGCGRLYLKKKKNQKILFHLNLYRGHFNTVNTSSHILFLLYLKITTPVLSNSISPHRVQVGAHYTWSLEVNRWPRMKVKIAEESKVKYLGQFLISTWMSFFFFLFSGHTMPIPIYFFCLWMLLCAQKGILTEFRVMKWVQ